MGESNEEKFQLWQKEITPKLNALIKFMCAVQKLDTESGFKPNSNHTFLEQRSLVYGNPGGELPRCFEDCAYVAVGSEYRNMDCTTLYTLLLNSIYEGNVRHNITLSGNERIFGIKVPLGDLSKEKIEDLGNTLGNKIHSFLEERPIEDLTRPQRLARQRGLIFLEGKVNQL